MYSRSVSDIAQTRFGLTLLPHVDHLAEGKKYVRGCPWCDMKGTVGDRVCDPRELAWYDRAQKSGRRVIMFGEEI